MLFGTFMRDRTILIDPERVTSRLIDLIRIPSMTGDEELGIRRIADWLNEAGAEVDYWLEGIGKMVSDPEYPGHEVERAWVPVVSGMIRGTRPGPTIVLTGHVDVVPPGDWTQWSHDPFSGLRNGDRVVGRGASDMKSGLIAGLETFETFARGPRDFAGRVVFIAVPAEEDSGLGTLAAIRRGWEPHCVLIPEPTSRGADPQVVIAHAGAMSCRIEIVGVAAHASTRLEGESALEHYLAVHDIMRRAEAELNERESHPLMKSLALPYSTNVGVIRGGTWSSSVMDQLEVEVRIGVGLCETTAQAKERFEKTIAEGIQGHPWLSKHPPRIHWRASGFGSAQTPPDHPLVEYVSDAASIAFGATPERVAAPYGCDMSAWVRLTGAPTVLYGPGEIEQAHATDESVSLEATIKVTQALVRATAALLELDPATLAIDEAHEAPT